LAPGRAADAAALSMRPCPRCVFSTVARRSPLAVWQDAWQLMASWVTGACEPATVPPRSALSPRSAIVMVATPRCGHRAKARRQGRAPTATDRLGPPVLRVVRACSLTCLLPLPQRATPPAPGVQQTSQPPSSAVYAAFADLEAMFQAAERPPDFQQRVVERAVAVRRAWACGGMELPTAARAAWQGPSLAWRPRLRGATHVTQYYAFRTCNSAHQVCKERTTHSTSRQACPVLPSSRRQGAKCNLQRTKN
jgi:hypothetical protein